MVPPQPSPAIPQLLVPQACAVVRSVQVQAPAVQVNGGVQDPQLRVPAQPSGAVPHTLPPQAWACVCGVQPQVPMPPLAPLQA